MNDIAPDRRPAAERPAWLPEGACSDLIAVRDWAVTPLGPLEGWPCSLRTVVGLLLRSPAPMALLWVEEGTLLFNDATAATIGGSYPQAPGRSIFDSFPSFADLNRQVLATCLAGMTGTGLAALLQEERKGLPILLISGNADDAALPPDLPRLTKSSPQSELAAALTGLSGG